MPASSVAPMQKWYLGSAVKEKTAHGIYTESFCYTEVFDVLRMHHLPPSTRQVEHVADEKAGRKIAHAIIKINETFLKERIENNFSVWKIRLLECLQTTSWIVFELKFLPTKPLRFFLD